jgi:hypothetical protein
MTGFKKSPGLWGILFLTLIIIAFADSFAARKIIPADEVTQRIKIHNGPVVSFSDSLFIDTVQIRRDTDYTIDYSNGIIVLGQNLPDNFSNLKIIYKPLPSWLKERYSQAPPSSSPSHSENIVGRPDITRRAVRTSGSEVSLSGAKKFAVVTERKGNSRFDQSLELTVRGELSPGVEIAGSLSDKGYDPAYGGLNSRISELDKLSLTVRSEHFMSQVGNLEIYQRADHRPPVLKQVSGMEVSYNSRIFSSLSTVARSRGQFESVRFNGRDGTQGPYRISSAGQIAAVVPGSEKVWLDGHPLERGADKDYIMDYPAGSITFTQNRFVDSRSRIEIDYEPLADDYQRQLYRFQSGVSTADSVLNLHFNYLHEGDDKNRTRVLDLSEDDIAFLESLGDSIKSNFRDGAVPDTNGAYIVQTDTAGNSYYEYAGEGAGQYSVIFTSVVVGQGDYTYVGSDEYRYVGPGNGDYLAQKRIPVPSSEDYLEVGFGVRPMTRGRANVTIRHTNYDKNIYSNLNDGDNDGNQYIFAIGYGEEPSLLSTVSGASLTVDIIEKNFKTYARRRSPDMARKYIIPDNLMVGGREIEIEGVSTLALPTPYNILVSGGRLD